MTEYENQPPQDNDAVIFKLDAIVSQDRIIGLLFDSFVHTRATLDAMAYLQIRALSQLTDLPEDDLEAEFQEFRRGCVVSYAQLLQEQLDEPAPHHSDE